MSRLNMKHLVSMVGGASKVQYLRRLGTSYERILMMTLRDH